MTGGESSEVLPRGFSRHPFFESYGVTASSVQCVAATSLLLAFTCYAGTSLCGWQLQHTFPHRATAVCTHRVPIPPHHSPLHHHHPSSCLSHRIIKIIIHSTAPHRQLNQNGPWHLHSAYSPSTTHTHTHSHTHTQLRILSTLREETRSVTHHHSLLVHSSQDQTSLFTISLPSSCHFYSHPPASPRPTTSQA